MTIKDVAREAGVSIATISRVINETGQIKPETRQAVLEAIRRTGYVVPPTEKRHRRQGKPKTAEKSHKIGFMVPDTREIAMQTALTGRMLNGISRELQNHGIETIFTKLNSDQVIPQSIEPGKVDAFIVKNWVENEKLRAALDLIPHVVCLETRMPEKIADQVMPDTDKIASKTLDYFLNRGIKNLAILADNFQYPQFIRSKTFADMAREAGCQVEILGFTDGSNDAESNIKALMGIKPFPQGIFISSCDAVTTQFFMSIHKSGFEISRDFEMVTVSEYPDFAKSLDPRIATIDLQPEEIGRAAAQTIQWRLLNPVAPQRKLQIAPKFNAGDGQ